MGTLILLIYVVFGGTVEANELLETSEYKALIKPLVYKEPSAVDKKFKAEHIVAGSEFVKAQVLKEHFDVSFSEGSYTCFFISIRNTSEVTFLVDPELATLTFENKSYAPISPLSMRDEAKKSSFFLNDQELQVISESLYRKSLKLTLLRPGEATHGLVWFNFDSKKTKNTELVMSFKNLENLQHFGVSWFF